LGLQGAFFQQSIFTVFSKNALSIQPLFQTTEADYYQMIFKVPSNPYHSMILWFYDKSYKMGATHTFKN